MRLKKIIIKIITSFLLPQGHCTLVLSLQSTNEHLPNMLLSQIRWKIEKIYDLYRLIQFPN
jgi:hypothetical protein